MPRKKKYQSGGGYPFFPQSVKLSPTQQKVMKTVSNLPIYTPDSRYAEYQDILPYWQDNIAFTPVVEDYSNFGPDNTPTPGSYFRKGTPSPFADAWRSGNIYINPSRFNPYENRSSVLEHETIHSGFNGEDVPQWMVDNLNAANRNLGSGEHANLLGEQLANQAVARRTVLNEFGLPDNATIPQQLSDEFLRRGLYSGMRNPQYPPFDASTMEAISGNKPGMFNRVLNYRQTGGESSSLDRAKMKAKMALAAEFGNPSARRMMNPTPPSYRFSGNEMYNGKPTGVPLGERGTHFMSSMGEFAVPYIQEGPNRSLYFNSNASPRDREAIRFDNPQDAEYFAEHYKEVAPMMQSFANGGDISIPNVYPNQMVPKFQMGGTRTPIYTDDLRKVQAYNDSLHLYNANPKVVEHPLTVMDELHFQFHPNKGNIMPIGEANRRIITEGPNSWVLSTKYVKNDYVYKKPVQPYIYKPGPPELSRGRDIELNYQKPSSQSVSIVRPKLIPSITVPPIKNLPYRVEYRDEKGNPTHTFFPDEASSREFWQSTPGEKRGYYEKTYQYQTGGQTYVIKPGDTLSKISRATNVSVDKLAKVNNIKNINLIFPNQKIVIPTPDIAKTPSSLPNKQKVYAYQDWEQLSKNQKNLNDLSDEQTIIGSYANRPDQKYLVVDKKNAALKLYQGNKLLKSYEVGVGANPGDAQTVTQLLSNGKVDWDAGNKSTGAGVYTISNVTPHSKTYFNAPAFNLKNDRGIEVATTIHGTPLARRKYFNNKNVADNRMSYGCINGKCYDLEDLYKQVGVGTNLYVLPEDPGNYFEIVDGKPVLRVPVESRPKYETFIDKEGKVQKGQGINRSVNTAVYKPIMFRMAKDNNPIDNQFAQSLVNDKEQLMRDLNINSDVYNDIAKMSLGVLQQETGAGTKRSYKFKESSDLTQAFSPTEVAAGASGLSLIAPQILPTALSLLSQTSGQDLVNAAKHFKGNPSINSRGLTQIKYAAQNKDVKDLFAKYGITPDNLNDPDKAAKATMIMFAYMYNNELKDTKLLKQSGVPWQDALLYLQQGKKQLLKDKMATPERNTYIKNVKNYMKKYQLLQKEQKQYGGVPSIQTDGIFEKMFNYIREELPGSSGFNYQDYYDTANKYLSRPIFKGTTLKAKHIADVAQDFYKNKGYVYPLDLLLTQGQQETKLGKALKSKNNFFNIGNTDSGKIREFNTPEESVSVYMNTMYDNYLDQGKKSPDVLLKPKGFVNIVGNRYASDPDYENKLLTQRKYIRKHYFNKHGGLVKAQYGRQYSRYDQPRFNSTDNTANTAFRQRIDIQNKINQHQEDAVAKLRDDLNAVEILRHGVQKVQENQYNSMHPDKPKIKAAPLKKYTFEDAKKIHEAKIRQKEVEKGIREGTIAAVGPQKQPTPALVQTFGSFTPSGSSELGQIGATTFVNMNPITGPAASAGRFTQAALGQNPYGFQDNGFSEENVMGALGILGDLGNVGMFKSMVGPTNVKMPRIFSKTSKVNPKTTIVLENVPEEIGGFTGEPSGMSGEEYINYLKQNPIQNIQKTPPPVAGGIPKPDIGGWSPTHNPQVENLMQSAQFGKRPVPTRLNFLTNEELVNENIFLDEFEKHFDDFAKMGYGYEDAVNKASVRTLEGLKNHPNFDSELGVQKTIDRLLIGPNAKNISDDFLLSQKPLSSQAKMTLRNPLGMVDENYNPFSNKIRVKENRLLKDLEEGKKYTGTEAFNTISPNKYGGVAKAQYGRIITDPRGQWAHPGENTRIPGGRITMQSVPYPVYGVADTGEKKMMYPEQEYNFPGAKYVDEYPMLQDGGVSEKPTGFIPEIPRLFRKEYGGPLKRFHQGKMTGPGIFQDGGNTEKNSYIYNGAPYPKTKKIRIRFK